MANSCDDRIREIEVKYHENTQSAAAAEAKRQLAEVGDIEERARSRVAALVEDHDRALRRAEDYYSTVQKKMLQDQNTLKDELATVTKLQVRVDNKLSAAEQENRRLSESLQEARRKLPELQKRQQDFKQANSQLVATKARAKVLETELRDVSVEHELLLQAFQKVQQERDELLRKQTDAILDVQQRSGLKHLLLDRKLAALTAAVEKKEAQLCAALSASGVDRTAGGRAADKLEEMLASKQATIDALRSDLARDAKEYDDLLRSCSEKLKDSGVPLYDFPFRPSERLLGEPTRVQDSPGPAYEE